MQDRINRMFGGAFHRFEHSDDFGGLFGGLSYTPSIDIQDKGDHYLVVVDAPGLDDTRLDIRIEGRTLILSGSVPRPRKNEGIEDFLTSAGDRGCFPENELAHS